MSGLCGMAIKPVNRWFDRGYRYTKNNDRIPKRALSDGMYSLFHFNSDIQ